MLDRSTILGLLIGCSLILTSILWQGEFFVFLSFASILIVVGGIIAATMINFSFEDIKVSFTTIVGMVNAKDVDLRTDLELLGLFSRRVRKEGMLALDRDIPHIESPFLKNGLQLAVDGFSKESLERILKDEIKSRERQVDISVSVMEAMSEYAPAFGMIGTVIGMVLMLQNISDPESLAGGLSVALLTTLYGTVLSNMFFGPLAGKLGYLSELDINRKQLFMTGIISIVEGENPRVMEKKMLIYLDPESRAEYIQYHEGTRINRQRDERFYKLWIEQQTKEWDDLKEKLELG